MGLEIRNIKKKPVIMLFATVLVMFAVRRSGTINWNRMIKLNKKMIVIIGIVV